MPHTRGALEDAAPGQEVVVRAALHGLPSLGTHDGRRPYGYPAARINRAFTLCLPVGKCSKHHVCPSSDRDLIMIIIMTSMCKEASMGCSGTSYAPSAGCQWGTSTCCYLGVMLAPGAAPGVGDLELEVPGVAALEGVEEVRCVLPRAHGALHGRPRDAPAPVTL